MPLPWSLSSIYPTGDTPLQVLLSLGSQEPSFLGSSSSSALFPTSFAGLSSSLASKSWNCLWI